MGFFKKIFKPVSKVLDKVIPNEIKPALPYLAAFAPVFGPAGMQSFIGSTMGRRALTSGLMNIGAQLSQEGNEGDINLLSAGLGALSGAMTVPGGSDTIAGSRIVGTGADGKAITASEYAKLSEGANLGSGMIPSGGLTADLTPAVTSAPFKGPVSFSQVVPGGEAGVTGLAKAKNIGLDFLGKGSDFLKVGEGGGTTAKLLSKEGLKIAAAPAAQATGDLMQAEARQLEKQAAIDAALAEAEGLADAGLRGDAIRNAMRAYGYFSDEEIESTVSSAGYRAGGRVGFNVGGPTAEGLSALLGSEMLGRAGMEDAEDRPFKFDAQEFMIDQYNEDGTQPKILGSGFQGDDDIFVIETPNGGTMMITQEQYTENFGERRAKGGRVGFKFGGIDEAIEGVSEDIQEEGKEGIMMAAKEDPMLLEEYNKYVFDLMEQRPDAKPMSFQDFKRMIKAGMKMGGRVKAEEGGLMNLGGKEMDLRGGGFVPIGKKEKADDVPARLSKNEFVMTADAVRAAGGGSVNEGAKRMYKVMNDLEARA